MADIPGWDDEIHGTVRVLIELVGDRLTYCTTSPRYPLIRQCAAAYLARARRLLIGMDVLYEAEMPDVLGGVLRIFLEAWITGMWVLMAGDEVLVTLDAHNINQSRGFFKALADLDLDLDLDLESLDPVDGASALPKFQDRFKLVEAQLVAEGDATSGELENWVHRVVYAAESGEGIHAGLISVIGHLIQDHERWGIRADRFESGDGAGKLLWATTLLVMLARRVFQAFGIGTDVLDEMAPPIQQLAHDLNEHPPTQGPTHPV